MTTNIEEKILHGTTTVGIKASDGVVLCADMRASAGYFIATVSYTHLTLPTICSV